MNEIINTGNDFADYVFSQHLSNDPFLWALTDYLEYKGILNREEFLTFVNERCKADVIAKTEARKSL